MVILLPVYLLFLVGLFSMGNLMMVRQSLISVTRNHAWSAKDTSGQRTISGPYRGRLQAQVTTEDGFGFNKRTLTTNDVINQGGVEIALDALNNKRRQGAKSEPFTSRVVRGTYTYEGIAFNGPAIAQTTQAAVMLPKEHERDLYDPEAQAKANMASVWAKAPADPSAESHRPLSPKYQGYFDSDLGVWDVKARIRGRMEAEHDYYRPKVN